MRMYDNSSRKLEVAKQDYRVMARRKKLGGALSRLISTAIPHAQHLE